MRSPVVSFIIPTLNAADILPKCLIAIRSQRYPQNKIEIIVADGGSKDDTVLIALKYKAKVITNPAVLHEPGKTKASKVAKGEILFYTDADNVLSTRYWLHNMILPYIENPCVAGLLPQTIPAPDSNPLDRYLGYLATDPFTWFVYQDSANPSTFYKNYQPLKTTSRYILYKFPPSNMPLFGLSQGVGTVKKFKRNKMGSTDDILAGFKMIMEGGIIAYIPDAGVYHYHVSGIHNFITKYTWRVKNNLIQKIKGMGITQRLQYITLDKKIRMIMFVPYGLTLIFPLLDAIKLSIHHKTFIPIIHVPACFIMSLVILKGSIISLLYRNVRLGSYA